MNGFWGSIGFPLIEGKFDKNDLSFKELSSAKFYVARLNNLKFGDDKAFCNTEDIFILTEGVVLNKQKLYSIYNCNNINELCLKLYNIEGKDFFKHFKGSFSGFIYDKRTDIAVLFTDEIGDRLVYYTKTEKGIIFSSELKYLVDILKENGINYKLNLTAAYSLLTYAYLIDNISFIENVYKLKPGQLAIIKDNKLSVNQYHLFSMSSMNNSMTIRDAVEGIDYYFRDAVSLQINKNREYDYDNYASLSAGLDSRMTVWIATELSSTPLYNFTYSETMYYDEITPKEIANFLGNHWIFKALDNGLSLFLINECIKINGGIVTNYGPAQVLDIMKILNTEFIGLIHTGMLGDKIIGSWCNKKNINKKYEIGEGAYSTILLNKFIALYDMNDRDCFENREIGMLYNRGFTGANMGAPLVFQKYSESFSPFYDKDFISFCYTIPIEMRYGHKLYYKWVTTKYPKAAIFPHNGSKILTNKSLFTHNGVSFSPEDYFRKAISKSLSHLGLKKSGFNSRHGMNPLGYWYNKNNQLREFMDNYYYQNIYLIEDLKLREDCKLLYFNSTHLEKNMVLTLLSAIKYFFE